LATIFRPPGYFQNWRRDSRAAFDTQPQGTNLAGAFGTRPVGKQIAEHTTGFDSVSARFTQRQWTGARVAIEAQLQGTNLRGAFGTVPSGHPEIGAVFNRRAAQAALDAQPQGRRFFRPLRRRPSGR
jgi:hypothetical protein